MAPLFSGDYFVYKWLALGLCVRDGVGIGEMCHSTLQRFGSVGEERRNNLTAPYSVSRFLLQHNACRIVDGVSLLLSACTERDRDETYALGIH